MGPVLTQITTPLSLAALCVLMITGILKAADRGRPTLLLKTAVHWTFVLALTLGVLANVSYIVTASFAREIRVAGSVRDDTGRPLGRAIVDIPGRGRGITDDYGAFELSIPDSRKADVYDGIVSLEGYGTAKFNLPGPIPKQAVSVSLSRPRLTDSELLLPPELVYVGHYLGMPTLNAKLRFFNPLPARVHVEGIRASVVSPDGRTFDLPMVGTYAPSGQFIPTPMPNLDLEKSQSWALGYRFFLGDQGFNALMSDAQAEYPANRPIPQVGQVVFSEEMARKLTSFMDRTMIWKPGTWTLVIGCTIDNRNMARSFKFDLSPENVERLRSVVQFYRTAYAVLPVLPDAPDGSSNVAVTVH